MFEFLCCDLNVIFRMIVFFVNVSIYVFKLLTPLDNGHWHLYRKIIFDGAMCVILCLQDKQMIIDARQLKTDTFTCNTEQHNL